MINFEAVDQARKTLGLDETATLEEIKEAYRALSLRYHPDRCHDARTHECETMSKKINNAKEVLAEYCAGYRYSFKEKDVARNTMSREHYEHLKRFYDGLFGTLDL